MRFLTAGRSETASISSFWFVEALIFPVSWVRDPLSLRKNFPDLRKEILKSNWAELLIGAMAFFKVIANVTPTEKDNKMFGYLDDLVSYFIKDKKTK